MNKQSAFEPKNLLQKFQDDVNDHQLWKAQDYLYLACSGGLDSVVLAYLLHSSGYNFTLLHCNFQLRGEESDRDEQFVCSLAKQLKVPVEVKKFDTQFEMEQTGKGVQEAARDLRYGWFNQVLEQDKAHIKKWLLTAHHADDQVETVLLQFFRGTGISGLTGMKMKNGNIVRPLLSIYRDELNSFAKEHGLVWVEDSSNASTNYTRNFLRHHIIPSLTEVFPALKSTMIRGSKRFQEIEGIYQQRITDIKNRLIEKRNDSFAIPINKLKQIEAIDTIMFEVFKDFGFGVQQIPELKKLFYASSGKYVSSGIYRVLKNREWLLIDAIAEENYQIYILEDANAELLFDTHRLELKEVSNSFQIPSGSEQALVNLEKLKFPLLVRKWKAGDYFYPLGMKKKKKLSRFMTDLKLSLTEKENQWVIESDKKIVWVIGKRIDNRFKIDEHSSKRVLMTISPLSE